jgi:hypothetical protein
VVAPAVKPAIPESGILEVNGMEASNFSNTVLCLLKSDFRTFLWL